MIRNHPVRSGTGLLLAGLLVTASLLAAPSAHTPADLTIEEFFRPPAITAIKLNPAGTHLAMTVYEPPTDSTGLRVVDLITEKGTGLKGTKVYDIRDIRWAGDERIIYSLTRDNLYASGLYSVRRDKLTNPVTLNGRDVVQVLGRPNARPDHLFAWVRRSARDEGRPGPLVELNLKRSSRLGFDADSGLIASTIRQPDCDGVRAWFPDRDGEVRYAIGHTKGALRLYRREPDRKWTTLDLDLERYRVLAVDSDPHVLLVARLNPDGLRTLVRYNTDDQSEGPTLYTDDKYDLGTARLMYSHNEQEVVGLTYDRQAPTQVWLRPEEAALQRAVDAALPPGRLNLIVSRSRGGSRLVVRSSSDRHPGTLYLFDRKANSLTAIANLAPWLPEELLGPVRLMTYQTRDGLQLDAYVTLPVGHDPAKPAPMIVLPHGGPWHRDVWGFNPLAQFFASRGYIVFQPNYRGSTGYGADISLKSRMEFRRMHDDVTDGTRALIKSGIADPAHIAIVGGSFGGYLAVCGAAFEPDLYRCAVTMAGVFDWERTLRDARRNDDDSYRYTALLRELGNPKTNQEKFEAMSPLRVADQIRIPVFIAHGEEDQVADSGQSHRLAKILTKAGIPCETLFQRDEAHGFQTMENRVELYRRIESFLKKNL